MAFDVGSLRIVWLRIFCGAKMKIIIQDDKKIKNQGSGISCGIH